MTAAALALLLSVFATASTVRGDEAKFDAFDRDSSLAAQTSDDRLLKAILRKEASAFGEGFFAGIIRRVIEHKNGPEKISADLRAGDLRLRMALLKLLNLYNIDMLRAAEAIDLWASSGPDELLTAVLQNALDRADGRLVLERYLLDSDSIWIKAVHQIGQLLKSGDASRRQAARHALVNASGQPVESFDALLERSARGDPTAVWRVSEALERMIQSEGALIRAIAKGPVITESFYESCWAEAGRTIIADHRLRSEYAKRSAGVAGLSDALKRWVSEGVRGNSDAIARGLLLGAEIPESRFVWMVETLLPIGSNRSLYDAGTRVLRPESLEPLAEALRQESTASSWWPEVFLWHLTRPGEALTSAVRSGLKSSNRREAMASGSAKHSQGAVSAIDLNDDGAWAAALTAARGQTEGTLAERIRSATEAEPSVATAWLQTAARNDPALHRALVEWLVREGHASSADVAARWLESLAARCKDGVVAGDQEFADFKARFSEFLRTSEGWHAGWRRMVVESAGLPDVLRAAMAKAAGDRPELFWDVFDFLCTSKALPVEGLKLRIVATLNRSELPEQVLAEVASQNHQASDAISQVWDRMLDREGQVFASLLAEAKSGARQSNAYTLVILCLAEAVNSGSARDEILACAGNLADADPGQTVRNIHGALLRGETGSGALASRLLAMEAVVDAVHRQLVVEIVYFQKAYLLASHIRQRAGLLAEWRDALILLLQEKPATTRRIMESMLARRAGDAGWTRRMEELRNGLVAALVSDRVLMEQILHDPSRHFRQQLAIKAQEAFDPVFALAWSAP